MVYFGNTSSGVSLGISGEKVLISAKNKGSNEGSANLQVKSATLDIFGDVSANKLTLKELALTDQSNINSDNITEGSTNIFTTAARTRGHFTYGTGITHNAGELSVTQSDINTDNITESSTNIFTTAARTRGHFTYGTGITHNAGELSVTQSDINTDNITEGSTNIFTTAARTRGHFTYGTGITRDGSGELSIGQDIGTGSDVQFKDLTITGNITFTGEATTINSTNTDISDNLIVLNSNFPNDTLNTNDSGILIERGNAANAFMGWDESDDKFVFGTTTATGTEIGDLTITEGTIKAATFEGNLTGDVTGNAATAT